MGGGRTTIHPLPAQAPGGDGIGFPADLAVRPALDTVALPNVRIDAASLADAHLLQLVETSGPSLALMCGTGALVIATDSGAPATLPRGLIAACTVRRQATIRFTGDPRRHGDEKAACDLTLIVIPHSAMARAGVPASLAEGVAVSSDPALGILLAQGRALIGHTPPPALAQACETHLVSLLAFAAGGGQARPAPAGTPRRHTLFQDIQRTVATQCIRHDFSAAQAATQHNMNVRTLQKLFQEHGTTFREYVTRARLEIAHQALLQAGNAGRKICDIAFEAGFNDIATFNRLFRRYFGGTPTAFRQRGRRPDEPA